MKNIAILCSGGDVSGMNPALKRFVEYTIEKNLHPYFIYDGYEGLIDGKFHKASYTDVSNIITRGGTIIGSARSQRFKEKRYRAVAKQHLDRYKIDKLIILGGDGSFKGMEIFAKEHPIQFCGIPSTIDNDINGTTYCLGVDTALNVIKSAIDSIRDTASSFKRAFVIETMGRECGYLALASYITSGAELCLIPEVPYNLDILEEKFKQQIANGRRYFIAIVAEGIEDTSQKIADWFEDSLHIESRVTTLGYIQRGGNPSVYDRLMAYKFISYAVDGLLEGREESVVCFDTNGFGYKNIDTVTKTYQLDPELLKCLQTEF